MPGKDSDILLVQEVRRLNTNIETLLELFYEYVNMKKCTCSTTKPMSNEDMTKWQKEIQ